MRALREWRPTFTPIRPAPIVPLMDRRQPAARAAVPDESLLVYLRGLTVLERLQLNDAAVRAALALRSAFAAAHDRETRRP